MPSRHRQRISSRSTAAIARLARSGLATPDMTAQDWAIESIRHSSLAAEPIGVPSSNQARRYQPPSQASRSSAFCSAEACSRHFVARAASPRDFGHRRKGGQGHVRKPGQPDAFALAALSRPCSCRRSSRRLRSAEGRGRRARGSRRGQARNARRRSPFLSETAGAKKLASSPSFSAGPSRKGAASSRSEASPVASR